MVVWQCMVMYGYVWQCNVMSFHVMYVCMCVCVYDHVHIYIHIIMHIYIYITICYIYIYIYYHVCVYIYAVYIYSCVYYIHISCNLQIRLQMMFDFMDITIARWCWWCGPENQGVVDLPTMLRDSTGAGAMIIGQYVNFGNTRPSSQPYYIFSWPILHQILHRG